MEHPLVNTAPSPIELYQRLCGSLKLSEALRLALETVKTCSGARGVYSNIYLSNRGEVQVLASVDDGEARDRTDRIAVPRAHFNKAIIREKGVYAVGSMKEDPFTEAVGRQIAPEMESFLLMKASVEERHWGVVIFWSDRPDAFTPEAIELVELMQPILSLIVGFSVNERLANLTSALEAKTASLEKALQAQNEAPLTELLTNTPSMHSLAPSIRHVAPYDATVLVTGDSGTGKEVVASVIHRLSSRRGKPFVKVNCAAIAPNLVEAELFGWERGAFTDARERHAGLFEQADGGTIFLDEVGELSMDLQAKLLRVLQQRTVRRLGGSNEIDINVRIIAATNRNLSTLVEENRFRLDLFYRLNVYPLHIEPLHKRLEDIEPLSRLFLGQLSRRYGIEPAPMLAESALQEARLWPWPGNVRELRNVITRAVLTGEPLIRHLPLVQDFVPRTPAYEPGPRGPAAPTLSVTSAVMRMATGAQTTKAALPDFESWQRTYFESVLASTKGKISGPGGAAEVTGIHPNTLRSRLKKLGLLD